MASMVSGVLPSEPPTPRLSKVITRCLARDAVNDPGVPVVEVGGQVVEEDHRARRYRCPARGRRIEFRPRRPDFVGAFLYDVPPQRVLRLRCPMFNPFSYDVVAAASFASLTSQWA